MAEEAETTRVDAPGELYDQEQQAPIAFRCDRTTRNQAKRLISEQWDVPYSRIRIRRVELRWNQDLVDQEIADGMEEPYDGWPAWTDCSPTQSGTAYWTSGYWDEPELYEPTSPSHPREER